MELQPVTPIAVENLIIDLNNPRYDPRSSQREALITIIQDQDIKLLNLAESIVDKGPNPSDLTIVTSLPDDPTTYIVLEGNRRVAALKLLSSPSLIDSLNLKASLARKFKDLSADAKDALPEKLNCVVLSREEANFWISLKHTGENQGIGVVGWDGRAKQRFRGSSPALQAVELVEASSLIDEDTRKKLPRIAITNVERILNTPEARSALGIEIKNKKLTLRSPEEESLGRLAIIISDIANRQKRVTDLDTKDQRIEYAKEVASRPLPHKTHASHHQAGKTTQGSGTGTGTRRVLTDRKRLIPRHVRLTIRQPRLNKIYQELQSLRIDRFANSGAVLFRVFVELSVDDFAQRNHISLKVPIRGSKSTQARGPQTRNMTLREKLRTATTYLENKHICTRAELHGIRALVSKREHVLSVDSLNAYVHNKDFSPRPKDLIADWNDIEKFVQGLWKP